MKLRQIAPISLGNILEWFDFGLFIFLAPIIGQQFFPADNEITATMATFVVFAAGFICRPIGGIIFGHFGDRYGRAQPLRYSILITTAVTFLVGVLPTYATAGLLAPILFTLLRLMQGISIGGEYGGVMTYLAESAPAEKRGFITSFAATGANMGFLLATLFILLLETILSKEIIDAWGWRLPFIFIGLVGCCISYYRLKLLETPAYDYLKKANHIKRLPILTALTHAPTRLLQIFGLSCMSNTFYYAFFAYMPTYLSQYAGISSQNAFLINSLSLAAMLFLVPIGGMCGDRWGLKNMLIISTLAIIFLTFPCFYWLNLQSLGLIILSLSITTIIGSLIQGTQLAITVENCPVDIRYSGISLAYNLGAALFGGTCPLILLTLIQMYNPIAPAYYIISTGIIGLITTLSLSNRLKEDFLVMTKN